MESSGRFSWHNQELLKCFLEKCNDEVLRVGRAGGSLKVESWDRIGKELKEKFVNGPSQRQMKNQYDYIKAKFQQWTKLKGKTGNVTYNPETNTFNLTDAQWDEYLKVKYLVLILFFK
jgi:hypothetical protein